MHNPPYDHLQHHAKDVLWAHPDYVFWKDCDSCYLGCNPAFAQLVGLSDPSKIIGLDDHTLPWQPQGHRADFFQSGDQATLSGTKNITRQVEVLVLPHQEPHLVQVTKRPLRDADGKIYGVLGVARDYTAEREQLTRLESILEESDHLHAEHQAWVRHLSHSLRTPLLSVMAMQSLLASALADAPYADSIELLQAACQQLHHRVHQLHSLTQLLADRDDTPVVEPEQVQASPQACVDHLVHRLQPYAAQKGLTLLHQSDDQLSKTRPGPYHVIESVLLEFIHNAIQCTDHGTISVRSSYQEGQWEIAVHDTGPGISKADLQRITQPFFTVHPNHQDPRAPLGLGLTQAKQALKSIGGTLILDSVLGQGSTFTLRVPWAKRPQTLPHKARTQKPTALASPPPEDTAPQQAPSDALDEKGFHFLLVEDNDLARLVLQRLFKRHGLQVSAYASAEAAWAQPLDLEINLVVTDLGLPGASGLQFAQWVQQHDNPPPVIALSAHLDADLKQQCWAVGMQAAYTKPLTAEQLPQLLRHARTACHHTTTEDPSPPNTRGMTMSDHHHLTSLQQRLAPQYQAIQQHRLVQTFTDVSSVQRLMSQHVWIVWDFVQLIKALLARLTAVTPPWAPPQDPNAVRLLYEILMEEETDDDPQDPDQSISHFSLYRRAMQETGADTTAIDAYLAALQAGQPCEEALRRASMLPATRTFLEHTWQTIQHATRPALAASFVFGREALVPLLFQPWLDQLQRHAIPDTTQLHYYLAHHIQIDSDDHGPKAERMLGQICGDDPQAWQEAEDAALAALQVRFHWLEGMLTACL